ncbi:Like-Sm ribonucleoprotein core [Haloprofundus marisrubri]|uniref:Like-Sm ribonucleoprotein core n=1 Tax=Haloprofundus marisrubri TaxID=1514971 RepID=A0A0W1R5K3_9EURY|nr:LSM domain-containing protein [Haloprofundus marisrubri]KTG08694.1 Like-Sm ribonucleoprotein core [Haloprofundus marisrubri]
MSGRPLDVLEASLNESVTVQLKDGTSYFGTLAGYDQHMNVVLEESLDDDVSGSLDVEEVEDTTIIRGDNVVTITT